MKTVSSEYTLLMNNIYLSNRSRGNRFQETHCLRLKIPLNQFEKIEKT